MLLPRHLALLSLAPLFYMLAARAGVSVLNGCIVAVIWSCCHCVMVFPLWYFFSVDPRILSVLLYVPIVILFMRKSEQHSWLSELIIIFIFDPPIMISAHLVNFLGGRLLTPFVTEFDDEIVISSLPFDSDIPELQRLNVGAVVNMCREYAGPNYPPDIVQLRLPTADTAAPNLQDLEKGVRFIEESLRKNKKERKRVLIHCKGGRARAATMALCYYLYKEPTVDASKLAQWMVEKRNVIVPFIVTYDVVGEFRKRLAATESKKSQ